MPALCHGTTSWETLTVRTKNPVVTVATLGGAMVTVPLRLLYGLAAPAQADLSGRLRRSIGLGRPPVRMSTDPAESYLRPDGVTRMVHSDLPSMLIGGISALLLQTLHPLAMAGVAEHSNYQADPLGRLRRTADFVGTTTFGTVREAEKAVEQVRRVHRRVTGVAPDGRPYSAGDPELVTFIHAAEVSSFLESARRFGPRDLTPEQCDQYYEEMAPVALALGAEWVPRSMAEMDAYFRRLRPELHAGAQALQARDWLRHGVSRRREQQAVYAVLHAAAVSLLPPWARDELGLSSPLAVDLLVDTVAVIPTSRAVSAGLRWLAKPQPADRSQPADTPQRAMVSPPSMATI
jgi:uncharacterized protein (DUF2236 family)